VCWRTVRQTSYVAKDGVTASGYSVEYTREIRAVSYSPVSDGVVDALVQERLAEFLPDSHALTTARLRSTEVKL